MTNADFIRCMDDDELYHFLDTITDCCSKYFTDCDNCPMKCNEVTPKCDIPLWLTQEVSSK